MPISHDGTATGHYAYSDFTVTSGGGSAEGYDAWLGDWTVMIFWK